MIHSDTRPAPPVPADLKVDADKDYHSDLRIPLAVLMTGALASSVDPWAWMAALRLWKAAWITRPAGSLPKNDHELAALAGIAPNGKRWALVRAIALDGFIEHSDGRLYHPTLAARAERAMNVLHAAQARGRTGIASMQARKRKAPLTTPPSTARSRPPERTRPTRDPITIPPRWERAAINICGEFEMKTGDWPPDKEETLAKWRASAFDPERTEKIVVSSIRANVDFTHLKDYENALTNTHAALAKGVAFDPEGDARWRSRLVTYLRIELWSPGYGPFPLAANCEVPNHVLREFWDASGQLTKLGRSLREGT